MKIRTKILFAIGLTLLGLLGLLYACARLILLQNFTKLESELALNNLLRVRNEFSREQANLVMITADWSNWDETYRFLATRDHQYINDNLQIDTLQNLGVNLIAFYDRSDQLVYAQQRAPEAATPYRFPAAILHQIRGAHATSGLFATTNGIMLIATRPVLTSHHAGPSRGTLLMAQLLNDVELAQLQQTTRLTIAWQRFNLPQLPPDFQQARMQILRQPSAAVQQNHRNTVAVYCLLRDVNAQPVLLLRVSHARHIFQRGLASIHYYLGSLLLLGVIFCSLTLWLIERIILARLAHLSTDVNRIGIHAELSARVNLPGNDELSGLAATVNGMLEALEASQSELTKRESLRESEERYRSLVEHSPDAVLIFSERQCVFANATGYTLLATLYPGVQGQQALRHTLPPQWLFADNESWDACLRLERSLRLDDGRTVELEIVTSPFTFQEKPAQQVILRNITERKRVEHALRTERAYISAAIDILPFPLCFIAPDNTVIRANSAWDSLLKELPALGLREMELLNPNTMTRVPFDQRPSQRALRGSLVQSAEGIFATLDGREIPMLIHAAPVHVNGELVAAVLALQNIAALKEADHAKDEFLAVLSHELLTPLTSILGWSETAIEQPSVSARALEVIQRNARRQHHILDNLLDVSKLLHGKLFLITEPTDLWWLALQCVKEMLPAITNLRMQLVLEPPDERLPIEADATRIKQAIHHLLLNALKFSNEGSTITLSGIRKDARVQLVVQDTGRGIPPELLPTLFTPFRQLQRSEATGGLGLGLTLIRGVVALHDGEVFAASAGHGLGSSFTIDLPLVVPCLPQVEAPVQELG